MTLSVIIPVFNCERFIEKCLQSLLNQSYQDFEIIVIDDGSTDASLHKAESVLAQWSHCAILHQENQGASAARNSGISCAQGEWITFVDGDDYLAPDYLEHLINEADDCDLLVSGIIFMKGDKEDHRTLPPNDTCRVANLKQDKGYYLDYAISPVGKLFRKEIIDKNHLRFDENLMVAEDRDFNIDYLSRAEKLRLIPYAGYYYQTAHEGSLSKDNSAYSLPIDILYWNKLYCMLNGTNEVYLAHRLFFFLVDSISGDLQRKDFSRAIRSLIEARPLIDRPFLRRNLKSVLAPSWQKMLVYLYLV